MSGTPPPGRGGAITLQALGELVRAAREARGLSLADVEATTHIRARYLEAIEAGRLHELPGEVFAKGFLRTYGNLLELDGAALVEDYKAAVAEPARSAPAAAHPGRGPAQRRRRRRAVLRRARRRPARGPARGGGAGAWVLAVLAVLVLAYVGHAVFGRAAASGPPSVSSSTYRSTPGSSAQAAASAPSAARAAAGGSAPGAPPKPRVALGVRFGHAALGWQGAYVITGASGLRVSLTTRQACWTRRWVDGSATYVDLTIPAGQTVQWSASHSLRVEIGNAPGVAAVVVDGQTGPALPRQGVNPEWLDFRLG